MSMDWKTQHCTMFSKLIHKTDEIPIKTSVRFYGYKHYSKTYMDGKRTEQAKTILKKKN